MEQQQGKSSSVPPSNELEIIDAEPLTVLAPHYKPRRGKRSIGKFIDGQIIGLPRGWFFEQRPRTNVKYIGKVDQFFYELGTNRQFRSLKSVEKYLISRGQSIKLVTPNQALQQSAQQKLEVPPAAAAAVPSDPSNASAENSNSESSNKVAMKKKKKKKASSSSNRNIMFNFKDAPEEVTWVLSNAENNEWASFMGEIKVPESVEQYWTETFMMINGREDEHRE